MKYNLAYRPYKRHFKKPLQTAQGIWQHREGILLRLEDKEGRIGFGEIAPLPSFGSETQEEALAYCQILGSAIESDKIHTIPDNLPCTRFALEAALWSMGDLPPSTHTTMPVAALLPSGFSSIERLQHLIDVGYKTFKWKIGRETAKEFAVYQQLIRLLPEGASLRIDANAALSREAAEYWLKQFEGNPVAFFEQPMPTKQLQDMRKLAALFQTPIALDESVSSFHRLSQTAAMPWPGPLVVKPSLLGSLQAFLTWRRDHTHPLVYSSAFETSIGLQTLLSIAASDPVPPAPLGIGTIDYFEEDGLCLHHNAAHIGLWRFTAKDFEALWDGLVKNKM